MTVVVRLFRLMGGLLCGLAGFGLGGLLWDPPRVAGEPGPYFLLVILGALVILMALAGLLLVYFEGFAEDQGAGT